MKKLSSFSVHAFLTFGGTCNPFRYYEMHTNSGHNLGLLWLLKQSAGYFVVYGNRLPIEKSGTKKFKESFHYLAINIGKKVIIDNKSTGGFIRFCRESFEKRMPTVHTILRFEKLEEDTWKVVF
jgi:hypothetical protein